MIHVRHSCGFVTSLIEWDALPIHHRVPFAGLSVPGRTCPKCKSTIASSSLEYAHTEETKAALDRIEASQRMPKTLVELFGSEER